MKYLLYLLLTFSFAQSVYAQNEYYWDSSADLISHNVYCHTQKMNSREDVVPISCDRAIPKKILDSILDKSVFAVRQKSIVAGSEKYSSADYTLTLLNAKKYYAAADSILVHELSFEPAGTNQSYGYRFLYHRNLGILAKKLAINDGADHPWCFLTTRRVMASNSYFFLMCLLKELRKQAV